MSNFKKLPENDNENKMQPEIRNLIWQRTRSNLGVVEMLLNMMDLFFVKAGATLSQSFSTHQDEDGSDTSGPENQASKPE